MKINPKLPFKLPASDKNEIFQIVSDGGIRKHSSKPGVWEIKTYLQRRYIEGKQSLYGDIIESWININQSPLLKVGSIWSKEGRLLANNVYTEKKIFSINPETNGKVTTLHNCFGNFSFIGNLMSQDLMTKIREKKPYFGIKVSESSFVIVSCSELLRFLFYRGPTVIEYLFNNTDSLGRSLEIHDLCVPLQEPSPENLHTLKVVLNGNRFSNTDIGILAELSISNHLDQEIKRVHNEFIAERYMKGNLGGDTSELYMNFNPKNLRRHFDFEASGINISYNKMNFFLVTSINKGGGLYTYKSLGHDSENKSVQQNKGFKSDTGEAPPQVKVQFIPKYDSQDKVIDDNEEAHSLISILNTHFDNDDDIYDFPSITVDNTIVEGDKTGAKKKYFQISPEILSGRLGGNDLNIGGIHADYGTSSSNSEMPVEEISQEDFFKEVFKKFQEEEDLDVRCLNFNNEGFIHGNSISAFPNNNSAKPYYVLSDMTPRKFGLIEIKLADDSYFYYIHIFDFRRRSGFMYKSNRNKFTEQEFNDIILNDIAKSNILGNWYSLSHEYLHSRLEMQRNFQFFVIVKARNTKNIAKIPDACIRDINELYRL